jgi:tRNA-specific 2-thiouridylase
VVALSGGVDSSVAAALLKKGGYDVVGVTLQLRPCSNTSLSRSCCGPDGVVRARATAAYLGIPHYTFDWQQVFEELVLRPSWNEYANGRTPNPCVICNQEIKFGLLRERADELGAKWIATGHYARTRTSRNKQGTKLRRGRDKAKDQSYFLFPLGHDRLFTTLFPLGELYKEETRAIARHMGLPNAEQRESQDACLGSDEETFAESLRRRFNQPSRPGPICNGSGDVLGHHQGIHRFTIGQRKRLGVALDHRAWVKTIDSKSARVVLTAEQTDLQSTGLIASRVRWGPGAEDFLSGKLQVQVRYNHEPVGAQVERGLDRTAAVWFDRPQLAVTPGQAVVFYDGDCVAGGGWIEKPMQGREP